MGKWQTAILSGIVAAIVAVALVNLTNVGKTGGEGKSSEFQNILATKTIRCGYVVYPPGLVKDPNTGKIGGIFPEALESVAERLGYAIVWAEEVGWGTMVEGLRAGRYDAVCSPVWANATRAQFVEFTKPLFFSGIGVYVRADDHRFDSDLGAINSPDVKIATIDGEMTSIIADQDYKQAERVALPQNSDVSQVLLNVLDRKADVTFVEPYIAEEFMKTRPGALRNLVPNRPVRIFPNTMLVRQDEIEFKNLLDVMLAEALNSGRVDHLLAKYDLGGGTFYPLALPYREPVKPLLQ